MSGATGVVRRVFVRDLVLQAAIGVYPHEHGATQRVRINVDLMVPETGPLLDRVDRVVDYEAVARRVRDIAGAGHIKLVETLADRIASMCLEDGRVARVRVRVEKLDVFADVGSVGVEVERCNPSTTGD